MKLLTLAIPTLTTIRLATGWLQASACEGEACTKAAATVAWTLDTAVDPCDDFFAFACR